MLSLDRIPSLAIAAAVLSGCALAACASQAETETTPSARDSAAPVPSSTGSTTVSNCEGLETSILRAAPNRASLGALHGAPDSVDTVTEANRHMEGATDSLFTVYYPGLHAVFRVPPSGRDLISSATITSNEFLADDRLGMGTSTEDVTRILGDPTRVEGPNLVYECGAVEQPVTFVISGNRVTAITISFYVD